MSACVYKNFLQVYNVRVSLGMSVCTDKAMSLIFFDTTTHHDSLLHLLSEPCPTNTHHSFRRVDLHATETLVGACQTLSNNVVRKIYSIRASKRRCPRSLSSSTLSAFSLLPLPSPHLRSQYLISKHEPVSIFCT